MTAIQVLQAVGQRVERKIEILTQIQKTLEEKYPDLIKEDPQLSLLFKSANEQQ